jgi:hypothetical protein
MGTKPAAQCISWVNRVVPTMGPPLPIYLGYCCKSRKSIDAENLAKAYV